MSEPYPQAILSSPRKHRPHWVLFVVTPGMNPWPEHAWRYYHGTAPTIAERTAALAELDFAYADDHRDWSWEEIQVDQGDDAPVELTATARVRPAMGGGS
ncbi:DUF6303 family protein [Kitasatospora sp. NPDC049285]|uniref:DUF6303 family protein n=1 Tax=Kitasatospora sp. NPDC049285 TaxID=3157096 RepID=UPI003412BA08